MENGCWNESVANGDEPVVDEWLLTVLQNPRNREALRKLEQCLDKFVADTALQYLEVPPKNAFGRKIVYSVAARYNLENRLGTASESEDNRSLLLIKTDTSAIPKTRLSDYDSNPQKPQTDANEKQDSSRKPLFLRKREPDSNGPIGQSVRRSNSSVGTIRGVTDEEYARVRARIFQREGTSGEERSESNDEEDAKVPSVTKPQQPLAPIEGSRGFTSRSNHIAGKESSKSIAAVESATSLNLTELKQSLPETSPIEQSPLPNATAPSQQMRSETPDTPRVEMGGNGNKTRAKWEDDILDPDFDRNIQRWIVTPQYIPLQQPHELMYPGNPFLPPGMMGAGAFGMGWMAHPPAPTPPPPPGTSNERLHNQRGYQYTENGMPRPGNVRPVFPAQAMHRPPNFIHEPLAPLHQPNLQPPPQAIRQDTKYQVPTPPADYCNVTEFPPLGRTAARTASGDKTGTSLAWEGRV